MNAGEAKRRRSAAALFALAALMLAGVLLLEDARADRVVAAGPSSTSVTPPPSATPVSPSPPQTVAHEAAQTANVYAGITTHQVPNRVASIRPLVYVPNNGSNSVSVIDPATFKVIRTFPVGLGPQHISPSWDFRDLYVGNAYGNSLTELDARTGRAIRTISVPDPYNLYFTPDGSLAIVVAERLEMLYLYDPHNWHRVGSVRVPYAGIDHLDFSANGRYLLISAEFSGEVAKVDLAKRRVTGALHVGGSPVDVKLAPNGSVFFVANQGLGGVSIIDPVRMKQVGFIRTGTGAHGFAVSRDATELYVSNRLAGSISVVSFRTDRVVHTWHVGGSPDMMQVSADGRFLWVSNRYDASVSVISTKTGNVLHVIPVGSEPHGLTLFPQPGRFSIGHNGVYR